MHKRTWFVSAVLCLMIAAAGCGGHKDVNYDAGYEDDTTDGKSENGEGSDIGTSDKNGGLLAQKLGIPDKVYENIPVDGTGLDKISISDQDVIIPDKDRMYTKSYKMGILNKETKEEIVKIFLDEDEGIYNYPEEMFNAKDIDRDAVDRLFEEGDAKPDYSATYFIGKIDGVPYVVRFIDLEWSTDEAFVVSRACHDEIPEAMAAKQATRVTYYDYNPDVIYEDPESAENEKTGDDKEADNACGLNAEQAGMKAAEYMNSWGFKDTVQTRIADMYRAYEDDNFKVIQYDEDGYTVRFDSSMNDTEIYQPVTTMIDTITHQSSDPKGDIAMENYYYSEVSYYQLSFNEDGLMDLYGYWPMRSDDELHPVDHLITWDEAVESLKKAIPQHFAGYTGYSEVTFNDVRLTYFRTKTGDKQYEVIPVYVFAQLESWAEESNAPSQLIMIDARDGSEVDVMQDPGRKGLTP